MGKGCHKDTNTIDFHLDVKYILAVDTGYLKQHFVYRSATLAYRNLFSYHKFICIASLLIIENILLFNILI